MKRSWNAWVWAGFLIAVVAFLSYFLFFLRFPATRDFPWINLLLFLLAGFLLAIGIIRAFRRPERYRGRVSGIVLGSLSLIVFGFFCYINFNLARQLPSATGAPQAGQPAPEFTLADSTGRQVSLSGLLNSHNAVLLIFYRGYW
ncbi:MAG TPA: hypothetical protein VJN43_21870 [Bryobacteraceae bacterium]|nr:hypothetical protein [Bryobacteraceae bacterium]